MQFKCATAYIWGMFYRGNPKALMDGSFSPQMLTQFAVFASYPQYFGLLWITLVRTGIRPKVISEKEDTPL